MIVLFLRAPGHGARLAVSLGTKGCGSAERKALTYAYIPEKIMYGDCDDHQAAA